MKRLVSLVAVLLFLTASTADAHRIHPGPLSKLTNKQLRQELTHARGAVTYFNRNPKGRFQVAINYSSCREVSVFRRPTCRIARRALEDHAWLLRTSQNIFDIRFGDVGNRQHWLCIFSHENGGYGWTANTGNGYYGGLQMDKDFMKSYGSDMIRKYGGYAHLWSPYDQMVVAERARGPGGRGYYPWPNTARMCGLI